jgi:uncharacterized membrane protein YkvI
LNGPGGYQAIVFKVAFCYIGAIVGAGFTSGQELMQFFVSLEGKKVPALIIVAVLFAVYGWITLSLSQLYQSSDYGSFLKRLLGIRAAGLFDLMIGIFLFSGLGIMLSAAGAVFDEHLGLPFNWGVFLLGLGVAAVLFANVQGVLWLNTVLMPAKFLLVILVSGLIIFTSPYTPIIPDAAVLSMEPITHSWVLAGVLYVSYNLILGLTILVSLAGPNFGPNLNMAGIWGGLGLGIFAGVIVGALASNWPQIAGYQVPMLYLAGQIHPGVKLLYTLVLGMGILTTAVACAYTLTLRLARTLKIPYFPMLLVILVLAAPLAQLGFGQLVRLIYPVFGYVGLVLLVGLTWRALESLSESGNLH